MGYGLLREPLHSLHQLAPNADEQHPATYVEYGKSPVFNPIRFALQGDGRADAVCVAAAVPDAAGRV